MEIVGIHDQLQFVEDVKAIAQGLLAVALVIPKSCNRALPPVGAFRCACNERTTTGLQAHGLE